MINFNPLKIFGYLPSLDSKNFLRLVAVSTLAAIGYLAFIFVHHFIDEKEKLADNSILLINENHQKDLLIKELRQVKTVDSLQSIIDSQNSILTKQNSKISSLYSKQTTDFKQQCQDSLLVSLSRLTTQYYDVKPSDYMFSSHHDRFDRVQSELKMIRFYASVLGIEEKVEAIIKSKLPYVRKRPESLEAISTSN